MYTSVLQFFYLFRLHVIGMHLKMGLIFSLLFSFFCCCTKNPLSKQDLIYDTVPVVHPLTPLLAEISGIADSKQVPGFLWAEQDGGNSPSIYLISHDAKITKTVHLKNAVNRDWEDMALAGNDIYIGDIGDNNAAYPNYTIYKFPEPVTVDTVTNTEAIRFQYPDGSHDAEAFLVDAATKDIFIITKRDNPSKIYKLSYPYNGGMNTLAAVGSLAYGGVVSAALSTDGKEIIVKTYTALYRYTRSGSESLEKTLQQAGKTLYYKIEPQGEAVAFAADNSGFYTLSEKGMSATVNLYFYKRK